ncbi:carbon monoxide dehydrogenase [Mycobacterium sp. djl-10]|nr:carbon monoxide dehydrogenase [Mycobacterium sp. djl-10]
MSTFKTALPSSRGAVSQALATIVAAGNEPLVVGGGTLTVPALVRGELLATHVVDLGKAGLDQLEICSGALELGALVSYQQVLDSTLIRQHAPLLHTMCAGITGGIQIRNQGTIVGALCAARPQSDVPAALVALDADVVIESMAGMRVVSVRTFLQDACRTQLTTGEFVAALRIRPTIGSGGYVKLKSAESSWPIVTAAAVLSEHVVLGGVATVPLRVPVGSTDLDTVRAEVADRVDRLPTTRRWSDIRADWHYRRRVAPEIAARAVRAAQLEAGNG